MKYQCVNSDCGLVIGVNTEKDSYICPNCGKSMFDSRLYEKLKKKNKDGHLDKKFHKYKSKIDDETIEELLRKEKKIKNKAEKTGLRKYKNYVSAFYKMIKDPNAYKAHKVIAAVALLYVLSPIDLIPDVIPVLGLTDDAVMVLIAVRILGEVLSKYINEPESYIVDNTLFYYIQPQNSKINYNYTEDYGIRMLYLHPYELGKYNLNILDDSLPKVSSLYVGHPNFYKTLVPYKNYDNYVANSILQEEINLLASLGAKSVSYTNIVCEQNISKIKGKIDYEKVINGSINASRNGIKINKTSKSIDFDSENLINTNEIDNLLWYFTSEGNFNKLLKKRICNGLMNYEYEMDYNMKNYLDAEVRANIKNKYKIELGVEHSTIAYQKMNFKVMFHALPDEIKNNSEKHFNIIQEKLSERREELKNKYKSL
ncbi:MAG: YkvA family protein [bacterium]